MVQSIRSNQLLRNAAKRRQETAEMQARSAESAREAERLRGVVQQMQAANEAKRQAMGMRPGMTTDQYLRENQQKLDAEAEKQDVARRLAEANRDRENSARRNAAREAANAQVEARRRAQADEKFKAREASIRAMREEAAKNPNDRKSGLKLAQAESQEQSLNADRTLAQQRQKAMDWQAEQLKAIPITGDNSSLRARNAIINQAARDQQRAIGDYKIAQQTSLRPTDRYMAQQRADSQKKLTQLSQALNAAKSARPAPATTRLPVSRPPVPQALSAMARPAARPSVQPPTQPAAQPALQPQDSQMRFQTLPSAQFMPQQEFMPQYPQFQQPQYPQFQQPQYQQFQPQQLQGLAEAMNQRVLSNPMAAQLQQLSDAARAGRATPEQMQQMSQLNDQLMQYRGGMPEFAAVNQMQQQMQPQMAPPQFQQPFQTQAQLPQIDLSMPMPSQTQAQLPQGNFGIQPGMQAPQNLGAGIGAYYTPMGGGGPFQAGPEQPQGGFGQMQGGFGQMQGGFGGTGGGAGGLF